MNVTTAPLYRHTTHHNARPQELLRRGFRGAEACARSLAAVGISPKSGRPYPTALSLFFAVDLVLRDAVRLGMKHPTSQTLRDAFDATDGVLATAKRATRSMAESRSVDLGAWSLAMAGLRAGLEDIEEGLERIKLLPAHASDYPDEE